jgi:hypothetical protein
MGRAAMATLLAALVLLGAAALARAADEQGAPPKASPASYKLVVEQYGVDGLIGSTEFTVRDDPGMSGVQL